jgi:hypothetical protein
MPNPFAEPGQWFRGNLHSHTTNSDGRSDPQATVSAYAQLGYDFLALTDHGHFTPCEDLDPQGLVLIPGAEMLVWGGGLGQPLHVVTLGLEQAPLVPEGATPAEQMQALSDQCQVCFIAHPFWSLLESSEILATEGWLGVEVYNYLCLRHSSRANSEPHWDALLARGCAAWGLAVDDCHQAADMGGAWIMAKSQERTVSGLLEAVKRGSFYATTGPRILDLQPVEEGLRITCSPCGFAAVLAAAPGSGRGPWFLADPPALFEEIVMPLPTNDAWLRVEVIDEQGHKAWSNPFRPDELSGRA